jgi:hypothetical protein
MAIDKALMREMDWQIGVVEKARALFGEEHATEFAHSLIETYLRREGKLAAQAFVGKLGWPIPPADVMEETVH